ncbi:hypothetical protein M2418_004518 [Rhizobium sp. BIGb0125]|jgi:hypothetical protein|uniref:hypothetical protein n=1 Tax=Rhizobium sp. BIGb0125 TaxID=2940618 RepID=UPI00216AA768|nr:hypothetical protein [Rhizobium sp. BIGb0125]MCS4244976.1 hypothetical protein [Rhizobium sp. BIGb0125]
MQDYREEASSKPHSSHLHLVSVRSEDELRRPRFRTEVNDPHYTQTAESIIAILGEPSFKPTEPIVMSQHVDETATTASGSETAVENSAEDVWFNGIFPLILLLALSIIHITIFSVLLQSAPLYPDWYP